MTMMKFFILFKLAINSLRGRVKVVSTFFDPFFLMLKRKMKSATTSFFIQLRERRVDYIDYSNIV